MARSLSCTSWFLLFATATLPVVTHAQCDCGQELNASGSCVFIPGINVSAGRECTLATDRFCDEDTDSGIATCQCGCYWAGDLCDSRLSVDALWKVIAIGVPLGLLLFVVVYLRRRDKMHGSSDWDFHPKCCVEPPYRSISAKPLLAYRFAIAVLAVTLQLIQLVETEGQALRAFTVWNWFLLTVYFVTGLGLSIKHQVAPATRTRLNGVEKLFWAMMVVEVVSVPFVALIFWAVLFPTASPEIQRFLVGYRSLIQHGFNVPIMYIDFVMMALPIRYWMYVFVVFWAAMYCFFHSSEIIAALSYENDFRCEVYFFLQVDSPLFLPWTIGLLVVYFVFHAIAVKLSDLKLKFQQEVIEAETKDDSKAPIAL